jgi:hypothetical protein
VIQKQAAPVKVPDFEEINSKFMDRLTNQLNNIFEETHAEKEAISEAVD